MPLTESEADPKSHSTAKSTDRRQTKSERTDEGSQPIPKEIDAADSADGKRMCLAICCLNLFLNNLLSLCTLRFDTLVSQIYEFFTKVLNFHFDPVTTHEPATVGTADYEHGKFSTSAWKVKSRFIYYYFLSFTFYPYADSSFWSSTEPFQVLSIFPPFCLGNFIGAHVCLRF